MTAPWKLELDSALLKSQVEVWPSGMLWAQACATQHPPSRPTFDRWIVEAVKIGKLKKVRAGIFLNAMGNPKVSPASAAGHIRRNAVPSLSWVLEQEWILNNFGDVVTCTVPTQAGLQVPKVGTVKTPQGSFRFHAIPWRMQELDGVPVKDWRDNRFAYPRATPEKAFADWLYLAGSHRSWMQDPPLDMDFEQLNQKCLSRIAKAMGIENTLQSWKKKKDVYDEDPEVQASSSLGRKTVPAVRP